MIEPITIERWQQAQKAERALHKLSLFEGLGHYQWVCWQYAEYLNIKQEQVVYQDIIELGPADFPMTGYFEPSLAVVIEPMPSEILEMIAAKRYIRIIKDPFENVNIHDFDEVWIFNVLQHVINPEKIIEKAKEIAHIIRFFEPIDQPACEHHPHVLTEDDFRRWFGDKVQIYNDKKPHFFDDKCAYGVWAKS